jgi:prepilin-type N-terminal cleavage/methylation domain-containing protein
MSLMKKTRQKGFTIVELMIVVFIGAFVIAAAGTVLVTGHKSFNEALRKANLQRQASVVMNRIGQCIKTADSAEVDADGKILKLYNQTKWTKFSFSPASGSISGETSGDDSETIINGYVEDLVFNVSANKVTITLKLKDGDLQTQLVSTVMMRNYE